MAKKRSKGKKSIPKKGDPDYLTPTQLRNRRKRRAKQKTNQQQDGTPSRDAATAIGDEAKQNQGKSSSSSRGGSKKDPSMKYISNPLKAPIVQAAKQYFKPILKDCNTSDFHVHLGPLYEWRTVSKLAVRPADGSASKDAKPKVAIGLFLPQSHALLPVPNCRAHHPSINVAVECITKACHEVGVEPYHESGKEKATSGDGDTDDILSNASEGAVNDAKDNIERGSGLLRYVAINVARDTGSVQITLVWNTPPPNRNGKDEGSGSKRKYDGTIVDNVLEKLVTKIISLSKNGNTSRNISDIEEKEGSASASNENTCDPMSEQPMKKKRRRGRRDGKSNTNESSNIDSKTDSFVGNNSSGTTGRKSSNASNGATQGVKPKLNLHSLWINYNPSWKHSNAIFSFDSSCWKHVHGPPAIMEHLTLDKKQTKSDQNGGLLLATPKPPYFPIPLNFPPNVFRQANLDSFTDIVRRIRERIQKFVADARKKEGTHAIELYGGVGTIGLHVSDVVSSLVSSDENPNNAKCFYDSVHTLPEKVQSRLEYKQKNAADMVVSEPNMFQRSNVLIVDPPRKGLDKEVVDYLCEEHEKTNLKLVVYVSCGFQAFQRDCDALVQSGRWKVEFAEGYLLFPGADAIETLAFFVPV